MRILLVRHGESEGNEDQSLYKEVPDHAIKLTDKGRGHGRAAGQVIRDHYSMLENVVGKPRVYPRMWTSPYDRAVQTADEMETQFGKGFLLDRRVNIRLREQEWGLITGLEKDEIAARFPEAHANYLRCKRYSGKFYARNPCGESRADVCDRAHLMAGTIKRDQEKHGINDVIIVCHGTTLRAFVMEWMHYTPEWFEEEPNPGNGAVRLIKMGGPIRKYVSGDSGVYSEIPGKYVDEGYIFKGFKD